MAKPLDQRIVAAMGHGARATDIVGLIEEIGKSITEAEGRFKLADELSKSASASEDEAEAAADEAAKLSRKIVRLKAKQDQLRDRHIELQNSERSKRLKAEYAEVLQRRDQLAADLKERWPAICAELVELIERINASDTECHRINGSIHGYGLERLISAEAVARGIVGHFYVANSPVFRFAQTKIASIDRTGLYDMAWPKYAPVGSTIAVPIP